MDNIATPIPIIKQIRLSQTLALFCFTCANNMYRIISPPHIIAKICLISISFRNKLKCFFASTPSVKYMKYFQFNKPIVAVTGLSIPSPNFELIGCSDKRKILSEKMIRVVSSFNFVN